MNTQRMTLLQKMNTGITPWIGIGLMVLGISLSASPSQAQDAIYQTIVPGDAALASHSIQPYTAKYRMLRQGQTMAEVIVNLQAYTVGGQDAFRLTWDLGFPRQTVTDLSMFYKDTFAPIMQMLPNGVGPGAGVKVTFYKADSLYGAVVPQAASEATALEQQFSQAVFEGGIHHLLLAALPLADGYAVQFPSGAAEGEAMIQARVEGTEMLEAGEASYEAWRIELSQFNQTSNVWVSHEAPYLIRRDISAMGMVWELVEVMRVGAW